jgi:hypothetical protein
MPCTKTPGFSVLADILSSAVGIIFKFDDAVSWRQDSIVAALRILCAAVAQEESFIAVVCSAKEPLKIVPVLRFQHIRYGSSKFRVVDVNLSRMTNLLFPANNDQYFRSSIVEYIGYSASSEHQHQAVLAAFALSMIFLGTKPCPPVIRCGLFVETNQRKCCRKQWQDDCSRPRNDLDPVWILKQ